MKLANRNGFPYVVPARSAHLQIETYYNQSSSTKMHREICRLALEARKTGWTDLMTPDPIAGAFRNQPFYYPTETPNDFHLIYRHNTYDSK